jgi:hypothetical protein
MGAASVVELRLADLGVRALGSVDAWMTSFAAYLVHELEVDPARAAELGASPVPWGVKLTAMVERHLFPRAAGHLVLAIDSADAAWGLPFQEEVFQLLRSWCELGAARAPWDRFRLLLALSSTPALLKKGPAKSPWNLAPSVHLADLSREQVKDLAALDGRACTEEEVALLMRRVGGHPELVRVVVQRWSTAGQAIERVIEDEEAGRGALGEHLLELGERLREREELVEAMCAILDDPRAPVDDAVFDRLRRAGVAEVSAEGIRVRFPLYETYLRRKWRAAVARRGR